MPACAPWSHEHHSDHHAPITSPTATFAAPPRFAPPTGTPVRANMGDVRRQRPSPWLGRWIGFPYLVSGAITMSLFIVSVVGLGLIPITVGIGMLALSVPATRWIADRHRAAAARLLGEPVPAPYRPDRPGNWLTRLLGPGQGPAELARPRLAARLLHRRLDARV